MPLVTITNNLSSNLGVPPPVARTLRPRGNVTLVLTSAQLEDPAITGMVRDELISVSVADDPNTPDSMEAASRQSVNDIEAASGEPSSGAVTTTDATVTTALTLPVTDGETMQLLVRVAAWMTAGTEGLGVTLAATFRRDGGTVFQVGTTTTVASHKDNAAWVVALAVVGTTVEVQVTGVAATTIHWVVGATALCAPEM